ncbi:hypothetical protein LDENG_00277040 [Lucifuga dentata]|nr:hypothetical protein LDENG_00277040 [Lucifuga dentata]
MVDCCNGTHPEGWRPFCASTELQILLGVVSAILLVSLCWNIFCCVAKCCPGKRTILRPKIRRSRGSRQMEENPIYGNIIYMEDSIAVYREFDAAHLSLGSLTDQQRVNSDSQFQDKNQDCYANLTLKAPKPPSGHSSPKIQYSDEVELESLEIEKETAENTDTISTLSDLYASVQTQRNKTINPVDSQDGYANHI